MAPKKQQEKKKHLANQVQEERPSTSAPARPAPAAAAGAEASGTRQTMDGIPALEPWMKQTVVLQLKEVNGKIPDMTAEVFGKKMVIDQGFAKAETLSIQAFVRGIFYVTFVSLQVCSRYWEKVKAAEPGSTFSNFVANSPIQLEERRVTVSMPSPHIPGQDIATFLKRFCTVLREPTRILDANGFCTGKWTLTCKLRRDPSTGDLLHLPQCINLGPCPGILHYEDMPRTCRRCGAEGHVGKDCPTVFCRLCGVTGHESKDCPRTKVCNLCGGTDHLYRECPKRTRSYAGVVRGTGSVVSLQWFGTPLICKLHSHITV
ncbi:uncharacterized protein [Pyxicephalus adspersus]|uniref:uncharacterized protein n=1 Tax=Pyxicephalus adspersus TaxID=30357 RepID=UPI003B59CA8A